MVVVVFHVQMQLRIPTHLLDWKRCSSSQSFSFSVISTIFQIFGRLWVLSPTRHLVEDLIEISLLAVGSVAIHLVHAKTNYVSFSVD